MDIFFLCCVGLVGIFLGSFMAAWIFREHKNISICKGRSMCVQCQHVLSPRDLIPVLSFLFLKRKCRYCHAPISYCYFVTEFLTGGVFAFLAFFYQTNFFLITPEFFSSVFISFFLIGIFVSDLWYQEIPFSFTILPTLVLLFTNIFFHFLDWKSMLFGAMIAAGFFGFQFLISRGKWIGGGDILLGIFFGVALGVQGSLLTLILGYILGALLGGFFLFSKYAKRNTKIPLGSLLSLTAFIVLLWGEKIIDWYLKPL